VAAGARVHWRGTRGVGTAGAALALTAASSANCTCPSFSFRAAGRYVLLAAFPGIRAGLNFRAVRRMPGCHSLALPLPFGACYWYSTAAFLPATGDFVCCSLFIRFKGAVFYRAHTVRLAYLRDSFGFFFFFFFGGC
jgi:hypothetical protein